MTKHYTNRCFVCASAGNLSRCTGCNLILYCGKEHQINHREEHKSFCRVIKKRLNEQKVSHIYENIDPSNWYQEINRISKEVETKLKRSLNDDEKFLLDYPRVCFVCKETKQEKLKYCPKCPAVSFCDKHPSSHIHDRHCFSIESLDLHKKAAYSNLQFYTGHLQELVASLAAGTKILKPTDNSPTSMTDFFKVYTKTEYDIKEEAEIFLSESFSMPLTIFKVLPTLYDKLPSNVIIHLESMHSSWTNDTMICWETLLHLLPEIKSLKIVCIKLGLPLSLFSRGGSNHIILCNDCRLKNRNLTVETSLMPLEQLSRSEKPTLIALFSSISSMKNDFPGQIGWLKTTESINNKVICPVVATNFIEGSHRKSEKELLDSSINFRIIYSGYNEFSSNVRKTILPNGSSMQSSQFMIILQPLENIERKFTISQSSYYPQICHVCRKTEPKVTCNRCGIIAYCDRKHQIQDQIHHKDMCEVICNIMKEMKAKNVFFNSKTCDTDLLWLRRRIELLRNVQLRLEKKLEKYEEEMFLFPKVCVVCHDSDSNLENCECGVFLCQLHKNDEKHKQVCGELSVAFKTYKSEAIVNVNFSLLKEASNEVSKTKKIDLMKIFVSMTFSLLQEISDKIFNGQIPASLKKLSTSSMDESPKEDDTFAKTIFIVNFLSAPLTLFHTMEKMTRKINSSMVIHVLGANREDFEEKFLWAFLFYDVDQMEDLKMIFIGPEFTNYPETQFDTSKFSGIKMNLKIEGYASDYDEYFSNEKFVKPDIILGFNLNIHEGKFAAPEKTWKKTILTFEEVGVPLVLTSGTKKRAEKDHQTICELLEKNVAFEFFEKNPFTSLCPQRDFETGGVMYSNNYIVAYDGKFPISSNSTEKKEEISEVDCEDSNSESKLEESETFLTERYKILSDENEKLKGQLDLANAKTEKQKNQILDLQKSFTDFVEKFKGKLDLANTEIEKQNIQMLDVQKICDDLKNSLEK